MKKKYNKVATLATTLITFGTLAGEADAALTFTVDTFTSDNLTITISTSSEVLEATGSIPASRDLFLFSTEGVQNDWILGDAFTAGGTGEIGGRTISLGEFVIFNNNPSAGDILRATFATPGDNFSDGDAVTSEVTASWTGTNIFDPTAVDSLTLTWGIQNLGSVYPFGDVQSPTAVAVPEPSATLLLGIGALGLVIRRKKTT